MTFESFLIKNWAWGGATFTLCLFSSEQWTDQNDAVHLFGQSEDLAEPLQTCPGTVVDGEATVTAFDLEPTVKSIDHPNVRLTGVLFDADGNFCRVLFSKWWIPDTPTPMTWRALTLANHLPSRVIDRYWRMIVQLVTTLAGTGSGAIEIGTATLEGGFVLVPTLNVTATSVIQLTAQDLNTNGLPRVGGVIAGTSFTIVSTDGGDSGVIAWEIKEPS